MSGAQPRRIDGIDKPGDVHTTVVSAEELTERTTKYHIEETSTVVVLR